MAKIGRNDPCPCGSGKKYKKCHISQNRISITKGSKKTFDDFLATHSSKQILSVLGALQLYPRNHGRNFRFEQLCLATLRKIDLDNERPLASWEQLKDAIESYTEGAMMEDPLSNAFTETAIFEQGNYIVYPGIYAGFTEILNIITECIFLCSNNLHKDFIKTVRDATGLLLFMSNNVAHEVDHSTYIFDPDESINIEFPTYTKIKQYIDAISFSRTYLQKVCNTAKFDINILNDFLIYPGTKQLNEEDPDKNVVNFKPLIEINDIILLYMPTGIPNALISYIYEKAKEYNCYDELMELLYSRQLHLSCTGLTKIGWLATDIRLPALRINLPIIETVFQFDNQKLAYVCYVKTGESSSDVEETDLIEDRTKEVVKFLSTIHSEQPFSVFCLFIIGETANDYYFTMSEPLAGALSLTLKYQELQTIIHSPKIHSLSLWKFSKCYNRTSEIMRIIAVGGAMDAYAIYRRNNGSLLHSDEVNPSGGMMVIVNGSSNDFKREVQKQQNEHAVAMFHNGRLVYTKVIRFKNYAPIYIEKKTHKCFRIVIENFRMPVWITSPEPKPSKESWAPYVCEAVAFWLNKMEPVLAQHLNDLKLVQIEIEIFIESELLNATELEIKAIDASKIELDVKIDTPRICISIPVDFFYAVMLPDNSADKILMTAVLQGISEYIHVSGSNNTLNAELIDEIVKKTLQPVNAKMILLSDISINIKMDDRNLPPMRYISDMDVSYILDNLVSYLPVGFVVPSKITNKKDKYELCDAIVRALIQQIADKLIKFDGLQLVKWLIKLNERCIQLREFREIHIPAKVACFSDFQTEVDELMDGEQNLVTTAHAIRTLIEFIAIKVPTGQKWPNYDDIDELLALTNQLTEWGALSEAMRMGIDDPEIGLLPSGRIGMDKKVELEAIQPYAIAKTESTIFRNIENFEKNYAAVRNTGEAVETEEVKNLNAAFKAEFGISLAILAKIVGTIANEGFTNADPCMGIEESLLKSLLLKIEGITPIEVERSLGLLTLLERESIGTPPNGYSSKEIFPWRYNRSISYIRRPLVKVTDKGIVSYCFGYRHLTQFMDNLIYLLYSSKLPDVKSDEMKSWIAGVSGDKGNPFREAVKKWFEKNSDYEIIQYEVRMDKDAPEGHIQTDKHYGDIDLLIINHRQRIIYPIECKNIHGGRNVHEMKVEMDDYLGRNGKDKKAKIYKHFTRNEWLNSNKASLKGLVTDVVNYNIKSFILTADEIPLVYLKKDDLPLPIKSFVFLRKNGLSYLSDL